MSSEAHAKVLALKRGVEWESLDPAGRKEMMMSAAMSEIRYLGAEAHAKVVALKKGGRVGVIGSCGAIRDGVSGHERAWAAGS